MRKKKEKLFSKIIIVLFLIMIAVGFMIPGSIDSNNDSQGYVEPRICQVDVDCYLICEDKPVKVLCSQNLCVQNTCEEGNYYSFNDNPLSFELVVEGNGTSLDLIGKDEDLFVKFSGNQVSLYSSGLSRFLASNLVSPCSPTKALSYPLSFKLNCPGNIKLFMFGVLNSR